MSSLDYINPPDCLKQEPLQLEFAPDDSGDVVVMERPLAQPWLFNPQPRAHLQAGQMSVTYISHACVELRGGSHTLVTDPWLMGPSFGRGWWLAHELPDDAWQRLRNASAIYISHSHPDHCNLPTLRKLAQINPGVAIYVPRLTDSAWAEELRAIGLTCVRSPPMGEWVELSPPGATLVTRFMILPDALLPHLDSMLLFEHGGHLVVNLVDCCLPHGEVLPADCDVLLTDFASGASGFPSAFVDQFGEAETLRIAKDKAHTFLKKTLTHIRLTRPKVWVPFAGYFVAAGPHDDHVRRLNWQNPPDEAAKSMRERVPGLQTWLPLPGATLDVATMQTTQPTKDKDSYLKRSWRFEPYLSQLHAALVFEPLHSLAGVQRYFDWANFHSYPLVLHVSEVSDDWQTVHREMWIDFSAERPVVRSDQQQHHHQSSSSSSSSPSSALNVLHIRARTAVFRTVLLRCCSWDPLYIGFSAKFVAEPNVYHFKFWYEHTNTG